jgi:hypothetical protein
VQGKLEQLWTAMESKTKDSWKADMRHVCHMTAARSDDFSFTTMPNITMSKSQIFNQMLRAV